MTLMLMENGANVEALSNVCTYLVSIATCLNVLFSIRTVEHPCIMRAAVAIVRSHEFCWIKAQIWKLLLMFVHHFNNHILGCHFITSTFLYTQYGLTPLHWAVKNQHINVVTYLIERGADLNSKDEGHVTPLHLACQSSFIDIATLLIKNGSSIEIKNWVSRVKLNKLLVCIV